MDIKYFKNVNFNSDYLETTIEFQNREIQLDINTDAVLGKDSWVKNMKNIFLNWKHSKKKLIKRL